MAVVIGCGVGRPKAGNSLQEFDSHLSPRAVEGAQTGDADIFLLPVRWIHQDELLSHSDLGRQNQQRSVRADIDGKGVFPEGFGVCQPATNYQASHFYLYFPKCISNMSNCLDLNTLVLVVMHEHCRQGTAANPFRCRAGGVSQER
jgi:hypothetical protein